MAMPADERHGHESSEAKEAPGGLKLRELMQHDVELAEATRRGVAQIKQGRSKRWADIKRRLGGM